MAVLESNASLMRLTAMQSAKKLAELKLGDRARVAAGHSVSRGLDPQEWALLRALGLSERCTFRVARAGGPWILQVRSTRIGLTRELAQKLWVLPRTRA